MFIEVFSQIFEIKSNEIYINYLILNTAEVKFTYKMHGYENFRKRHTHIV